VNAKGKAEVIDDKRNTDPGLSAAERKALRNHEAQEAIADHEEAQKAFHENRERLREERLRREPAAGPMFYPASELPDDTLTLNVRFSTRIRKALNAEGIKTIGEIEASDAKLLSLPDFGKESVAYLRQTLGLASAASLRPK
jgi:DNA-directed RNA polymerase alpha subunit